MSMITHSQDGQARKAAAQAVIEITDRLAAAEEEAATLRRALKDARSLTKVRNTHLRLRARLWIWCHDTSEPSSRAAAPPATWQ